MKILSVNKFHWRKGGSESVFFNEMDLLKKHGHEVVPFCMQSEKNLPSEYEKYFVTNVDYAAPGVRNKLVNASKIIFSIDARTSINRLLEEFVPDIAHFHIFQHQISPSVFGPLKKKDIPIVLTLHDLKPLCPIYTMYVKGEVCEKCKGGKYFNCLANRCTKGSLLGSFTNTFEMYFHKLMGYYEQVDRYIAVSQFYHDKMIEFGFPAKKIVYIPNALDVDETIDDISDDGYVLYFGRLSEEKGLSTILDFAKMASHISVKIVGEGPLRQYLEERVDREKIRNVSMLGFKTGECLDQLVRNCTCVVVPSKWYENCPMSILESFAASKPVVGSQIGGIPELIADGVDGYTFPVDDVEALTERVTRLCENRSEAMSMGQAGKIKVIDGFGTHSHVRSIISLYNDMLK